MTLRIFIRFEVKAFGCCIHESFEIFANYDLRCNGGLLSIAQCTDIEYVPALCVASKCQDGTVSAS